MTAIPEGSGIYRIVCSVNDKVYIGSSIDLPKRWRNHLHGLRRHVHHSITLQRAFDLHGESAFAFEVIEFVLPPFLLEREQYWLDTLQTFVPSRGYNINRSAFSRLGTVNSPETREKLRRANLGKVYGEETRQKHAEAWKGKTHRPETREKVRQIRLGTKRSDESRERSRLSHLGKTQSEETKEKRRISKKGYTHTPETRAKIRETNVASQAWRRKTIIATAPDGTVYTGHGIGQFAKAHNLNRSALTQVALGNAPHHKGWTVRYA